MDLDRATNTPPRLNRPILNPLPRRRFLGATATGVALTSSALLAAPPGAVPSATAAPQDEADGVVLVRDGAARAVIVTRPDDRDDLVLEAESGELTAPMRIVEDPDAAGGSYVDTPADGPDEGSLALTFDIATDGTYGIWARLWCETGGMDSYLVQIDDEEPFAWLDTKVSDTWAWWQVSRTVDGRTQPVEFALSAGSHTLTLITREAGARIDQVRIGSLTGGDPDDQVGAAVDTLVDCVATSTGVTLPVRASDDLDDDLPPGRVYVGWQGPGSDPEIAEHLDGLDVDGYVISPYEDTLTIVGPSDWGTRYGVYELLERHLGVRWLMPGPDGEDVPQHASITIGGPLVVDEPDFKGRSFAPLFLRTSNPSPVSPDWTSTDPQVQWATRNRTRSRTTDGGNHVLYKMFPPALYADPDKPDTFHPEYYPIVDGKTKLPALDATYGWQPRLDIPETVDVAITYALDFFADNPEAGLLSLSVNDNGGFSDTDIDPGGPNSMGFPDATASYYAWVNKVVTGIVDAQPEHADKIFPVLAYREVIDPPDFDLHPQVIPMVTRDSNPWADEALRPKLQASFTPWESKADELIWYDYASGAHFIAPRLYLHSMAEAYRWAYEHKVRYQYAAMYPSLVGEGPKTWIYAKLLWDVNADVDALVDDWCLHAVGAAAAPHLRAYFDHWERLWAGPILDTPFWATSADQIVLQYRERTSYLDLISEQDLQTCREHLEQARAKARTAPQRRRAELVLAQFAYLEASCQSYPMPVPAPETSMAALRLGKSVRRSLDSRVEAAQRRIAIGEQIEDDPVLRGRYDHRDTHYWTGHNGELFFRLVDHLSQQRSGWKRLRSQLADTANAAEAPQAARFAALALGVADGSIASSAPNGAFEESDDGTEVPPWRRIGNVEWAPDVGRDGTAGLRSWADPGTVSSADVVLPVPVSAGLVATRLWYRASGPGVSAGVMSLKYHWWTADGDNILVCQKPMRFITDTGQDWAWVSLMDDIPASVLGQEVGQLRLVGSLIGFEGDAEIHWDDFQLYTESS